MSTTKEFSGSAKTLGRAMFYTDRTESVPRAPQDRGPLSATEKATMDAQRKITGDIVKAYDGLCQRYRTYRPG